MHKRNRIGEIKRHRGLMHSMEILNKEFRFPLMIEVNLLLYNSHVNVIDRSIACKIPPKHICAVFV